MVENMSNFIDIKELIASISSINSTLGAANYLLREQAVINDSVYDALRRNFVASKLDEAIKHLHDIHQDFFEIGYSDKEVANV